MLAAILPSFGNIPALILFWFSLLTGLIWLKRHRDLNRGARDPVLGPDEPGPPEGELPPLTVLVAAKDEQDNIGRCLRGLLAQDYPDLQVVAINDRSDDRTGAILDELAATDPRLTAVHVTQLPDGWFGKNNAMHQGMQQVAHDRWLCFTDADCTYDSPHLLRSAARFALRNRLDMLSVLPRLEAATVWERVVQPVAGAIMVFWYPPQLVNSTGAPHAYANGAFMLMPRRTYDAIGGHEPVKATLNEDMHMARRVKAASLRLHVIRGGDLYRVRMYTGFRQIWRGWSRIFYGCLGTFPRLFGSVLMLTFLSVGPWLTLLFSPLLTANWPALAAAALFAVVSQQSVMWRFYDLTESGRRWAITYPLGAAVCLGMTLSAMRRLSGSITTWRGTTYRGGAHS